MPECAKTHLQQSRISKFSGEDPRTPSSNGGEGRGREGRRGREREGGKGRIGKGGEGREGTGEGRREGGREEWEVGRGGEGRGARHGLRPPRYKLWIRPWQTYRERTVIWTMNAAVLLRSRRLIIVRTLVLDVLPLSKMLTVVPLTFLLRAATVH